MKVHSLKVHPVHPICWAALMMCAMASAPTWAQPHPCTDVAWDLHQERALFAGQPHAVQGGTTAAATPTVRTDHLYEVHLAPQPRVKYVTAPGKVMLSDGAYGGMVKFRVPHSGGYRVSLDAPFWIDVVVDGKPLGTEDFTGQRGCANPHKIVLFRMPAGQELWLQISGARRAQAQFTVTEAPATQVPAAH